MTQPYCPICRSSSIHLENITWSNIQTLIMELLPDLPIPAFSESSYSLNQCTNCNLQFADPMTPGSKNFYEWIVRSNLYYPAKRWEWNQSIHFVKQNSVKTLLDVGCGSGAFLETVKDLKLSSFGIDLDPISVSECKKKGISALAMPIETAAVELKNSFDVITMFHVVEHLADPLNSLKQLSQCLNQSGAIIFSVPNSPMSFEANWIDPLNRPPHHLTRWNKSAILRLADLLGMNCLILSEIAPPFYSRIYNSILLALRKKLPSNRNTITDKVKNLFLIITNFKLLIKVIRSQIKRDQQMKSLNGDIILAIMTKS